MKQIKLNPRTNNAIGTDGNNLIVKSGCEQISIPLGGSGGSGGNANFTYSSSNWFSLQDLDSGNSVMGISDSFSNLGVNLWINTPSGVIRLTPDKTVFYSSMGGSNDDWLFGLDTTVGTFDVSDGLIGVDISDNKFWFRSWSNGTKNPIKQYLSQAKKWFSPSGSYLGVQLGFFDEINEDLTLSDGINIGESTTEPIKAEIVHQGITKQLEVKSSYVNANIQATTSDNYYTIQVPPNSTIKNVFVKVNNIAQKPSYIWSPLLINNCVDNTMICSSGNVEVWVQISGNIGDGFTIVVEYI